MENELLEILDMKQVHYFINEYGEIYEFYKNEKSYTHSYYCVVWDAESDDLIAIYGAEKSGKEYETTLVIFENGFYEGYFPPSQEKKQRKD